MLHKDTTLGSRHAVHNWEVADYAALTALVVSAADKGKMALVGADGFYLLLNHVGPIWQELTQPPNYFTFQRTNELIVAAGEARWYPPTNLSILSIEAWVSEAPEGADVIATLKKSGAAVATITIPAGANVMADMAVNISVLTTEYLTVDITQVGSTTAGRHLCIRLGMN